jgi:hypothetical protein
MGETVIEVDDWATLDGLVTAMAEVGEQMAATTSYAVGWMCRPDGFVPSPVCLLRPLAEVLELVAGAFAEVGRVWDDDWERMRDATTEASRRLRASDLRGRELFDRRVA